VVDKQLAKDSAKARVVRHELEKFHGKKNPKAVAFAWPHLDSPDRFIRYAARIAIESQPVAEWQDRAIAETHTNAALTSLLALARLGGKDTQTPLLKALTKFPIDNLTESQKLEKLRVIELSFIRQGKPDEEIAKMGIEKLVRQYPAKSEWLNHELCELLIYLQAPDVVKKTLALLDAAPTQEEQIHYILHLRKLAAGWTLEDREHYFSWFNKDRAAELGGPTYHKGAGYYPWSKRKGEKPQHSAELLKWFTDADREYGDGSSFPKFIAGFKKDAIETLTEQEKTELADFISDKKPEDKPKPVAEHKFVKDWKMEDLQRSLGEVTHGRSFGRVKSTYTTAQCLACHRFGNEGGSVGPELTAVSSRFTHRDILESILEPSKVLSEQYQNTIITKKDGDDVIGRIAEETDQKVVVVINPLSQTRVEVMKSDIEKRVASKVSPMPEGLVNTFTKDEILDLIAYMESGGKEGAPAFAKKTGEASDQPKTQ
jgi:putative heme-binding domain-containing protein